LSLGFLRLAGKGRGKDITAFAIEVPALDYEALDGTVGDAAFVSIASLKRELQ
jgi:hypothetical protein